MAGAFGGFTLLLLSLFAVAVAQMCGSRCGLLGDPERVCRLRRSGRSAVDGGAKHAGRRGASGRLRRYRARLGSRGSALWPWPTPFLGGKTRARACAVHAQRTGGYVSCLSRGSWPPRGRLGFLGAPGCVAGQEKEALHGAIFRRACAVARHCPSRCGCRRLQWGRSPIPPLSTLTSRATHAHPTSPLSTGLCATWACVSLSSCRWPGAQEWSRVSCHRQAYPLLSI